MVSVNSLTVNNVIPPFSLAMCNTWAWLSFQLKCVVSCGTWELSIFATAKWRQQTLYWFECSSPFAVSYMKGLSIRLLMSSARIPHDVTKCIKVMSIVDCSCMECCPCVICTYVLKEVVCPKYPSPSQERRCQHELLLSGYQTPPQLTHPKQPQGSSSPTGEIRVNH